MNKYCNIRFFCDFTWAPLLHSVHIFLLLQVNFGEKSGQNGTVYLSCNFIRNAYLINNHVRASLATLMKNM